MTLPGKGLITLSLKEGDDFVISVLDQLPLLEDDKDENQPGTSSAAVAAWAKADGKQVVDKEEANPLPVVKYREIDNYPQEDWIRPQLYIKLLSEESKKKVKTSLDDDIQYQVDEADTAWLELINEERNNLPPVTLDVMELYLDRLEKESFLQMESAGVDQTPVGDDDALCCICSNGDCTDTDMIIFCEVCNIAVHQECYGVYFIPEGPWVCRRCLLSPSREVSCILCPNKGGAFKQTDDKRWAHVACALWVPETSFTNTMFREPVEGVEYIPQGRWKLTCFICKCKGEGACIQCHKSSCYVAFHVTCAIYAGVYMKIEAVFKGEKEIIKKIAYCNNHAPNDHENRNLDTANVRSRLKECRRMLAEKRNCKMQTVSIPEIQPSTVAAITALSTFPEREEFMKRLVSYWKLKRIKAHGVPLLPSLQSALIKPAASSKSRDNESAQPLQDKQKRKRGANLKNMPSTSLDNAPITLKRQQKLDLSKRRPPSKLSTGGMKISGSSTTDEKKNDLEEPTTSSKVSGVQPLQEKRQRCANPKYMAFSAPAPFTASITLKRLQKAARSRQQTYETLSSTMKIDKSKSTRAKLSDKNAGEPTTSESSKAKGETENLTAYQYLWKLRQHMEQSRLLLELTIKRERYKARLNKMSQEIWSLQNMPFSEFVGCIIDLLMGKDEHKFFTQPVDLIAVPDYLEMISNPMDLGTMKENAKNHYYDSLMELKSDFELMIDNCLQYNTKETIYYKAALKLRREGKIIFDEADKMCDPLEFSSEQRLNPDNMPFGSFVVNLIDSLIAKDEKGYFTEPVDLIAVPDYLQVISNPMDLGTMKESAKNDYYTSLMELKTDFDTMIDNCLLYNDEETIYHQAAIRLRKEGETIFNTADKMCVKHSFSPEQRLKPRTSRFRPKKTVKFEDDPV